MINLPLILIIMGIVLILLAIITLITIRKKRTKPDYCALFIVGLIWIIFGIPLKNYVLSVVGLIFVMTGLVNRRKWKENRFNIKTLNKKEKIAMAIVIGALALLLTIIIILSTLIKN